MKPATETGRRTLSGVPLALLALLALFVPYGNWFLALLFVAAIALLGLYEFYKLTDRGQQGRALTTVGIIFSSCIVLLYYMQFLYIKQLSGHDIGEVYSQVVKQFFPTSSYLAGSYIVPSLLFLFIVAAFFQLLTRPLEGATYSLAVTVLGPIYTVITMCHVFLLFALPGGTFYLLLLLLIPISMDVGAYFSGRWFGRHRSGIKASPNKTYEGYIGGALLAGLISQGYLYACDRWGFPVAVMEGVKMGAVEMILFAILIAALSVMADLTESVLKRDAHRKDSASIIPGHGGILDLMDAIFWSLPVGYYYLLIRGLLTEPLL